MSFGGFGTTPTTTSFGTSTFGQPVQPNNVFGASTPTNTFGAAPATTSAWPSFSNTTSSGFGTSPAPAAAKTGTQHTPYTTTTESTGKGRLTAITAMPAFKEKSFEELRYEDYMMLKGQTPIPTTQTPAATTGFGTSTGFGSSATTGFGSTTSMTPSSGFGSNTTTTTPGTSSWSTSTPFGAAPTASFGAGFGANSTSTFGQPATSPFGTSTSTTTPAFGFGSSQPTVTGFGTSAPTTSGFGTTTSGTGFGATPSAGFGSSTTTNSGFGSTTAPSTGFGTSTFGSTPATSSGFGTSTFSQPASATFGTGSFGSSALSTTPAFGQTTTTSTGGLFGSSQTQPTSGGLFGSVTAPPASGGSLFGSQPATNTSSGGLFGQPASTTPTGGLFGQSSTATQPFGSTTTSAAPTSGLFGNSTSTPSTGSSLFGSSTTNQPSGGLFGQPNKPATNLPFAFGSAAMSTPSTTTGFGTSTGGLFGSQTATATQPATTSLFGTQPTTSTTTRSTGFGFGSATGQTQPASSLFGGTSTSAAAPSPFSFGASTTAQPSLFGTGQQSSLFGSGASAAKPATSLFGTPSTTTPSSTFQFGLSQLSSTPAQPSSAGGIFGGFGSSTPSAAGGQLALSSTQMQLQPYQTPLKPPPSIDSNPFGLKELPSQRPDSTNLTFQTCSHLTTPKTGDQCGGYSVLLLNGPIALQRPGLTSATPTPQSVARLRTRVRHAGPVTPAASLSLFDDKLFSISTLTSASRSVIPKVFRPQMPPKIELDESPASPVPSFQHGIRTPSSSAATPAPVPGGNGFISVLDAPIDRSPDNSASKMLLIRNFRAFAERGYTFTPSLQALESMSPSQLRCVTLQITKEGCGFARWTDFDLLTWSNHDLDDLVSVTDKSVKLKGPAKRGNVICGIKAKTESQSSKLYEEKVRKFMAAKGFELLGLEDGYYSFNCNFGDRASTPATPLVPPFQVR